MALYRSSLSLEYFTVAVEARDGSLDINPTTDAVAFAFTDDETDTQPSTWIAGSWETDTSTTPPTYRARCLVGPGGSIALAAGRWRVWIRATDHPEIPVRPVGSLIVF